MTILDLHRQRSVTAAPSRALRALPSTALLLDVLVIVSVGTIAAIGRERLGVFDKPSSVIDNLGLVAPLILTAWLIAIYTAGGYRANVFGAGTDELKRVINASLVTAGLVGVGCYLAKFPLSARLLRARLRRRHPRAGPGPGPPAPRAAQRPPPRQPCSSGWSSPARRAHVDEIASVLRRERGSATTWSAP